MAERTEAMEPSFSGGAGVGDFVRFQVLHPRGELEPPPTLLMPPRIAELAGKRVAFYSNGKGGTDVFFDTLEKLLKERFPTATVLRYTGAFDPGEKLATKMARECDTFIDGVGD